MPAFDQIVGQVQVVRRLQEFADHFLRRGEAVDHFLLVGPEGMGQTAITEALAEKLGSAITLTSGELLEKKGDLTAILTSLNPRDFIVIKRARALRPPVLETLGQAMSEFRLDLVLGQGSGARIHPYKLNRFTCVACVEKEPDLSPKLNNEFALRLMLQPYTTSELSKIVTLIVRGMNCGIEEPATSLVAKASQGSPRQAQLLIRRIGASEGRHITERAVQEYLSAIGVWVDSHPAAAGAAAGIDSLSGGEFERVVANLLSRMGFQVELTKTSGDGGIDVVAHFAQPFFQGRYLIQCKRFSALNTIGAPVIREFYGAVRADHTAVKGIFVTTSSFTEQAKEFAERVGIELIDREGLERLLRQHGVMTEAPTPPRPLF